MPDRLVGHSCPAGRARSCRRSGSDRARSCWPRCRRARSAACRCFGTSKLVAIETMAPDANSIVPATCVATSTSIFWPLSGSLVMRRSLRTREVDPGDARDGSDEVDQRGDVVRPHVEHRTAAGGVVEGGIRMPALVTGTHEEGRASHRLGRSRLRRRACGRSGGRHRERCRAHSRRAGRACRQLRAAFARRRCVSAQRLLRMDVLAGGDRHQADLDVRRAGSSG